MKQPKQAFDIQLIKDVKEYHAYHGDKDVKLIGFVCDPVGESLILTHVTDENGKKASCLLEFEWGYGEEKFNIREFNGGPREEEYCMLCQYMGAECNEHAV